ncbi:helix-turn-helix transcriptional regulator [Microbacterium sp. NC79]|nr:helix-turn-helix transcriptional regulator [Microbacterium sp. NC79]
MDCSHDRCRLRAVVADRRARGAWHVSRRDAELGGDALMVKPTQVTNNIKALRGELTQAELARQLGVTRQTIIAIEQGKYSPTLELAFRLARVLGAPLDEVFQYPEE